MLEVLVGCYGVGCCNVLVHGSLSFSCRVQLSWGGLILVLATPCCRLLEEPKGELGVLFRSMLFTILGCLFAARSCA